MLFYIIYITYIIFPLHIHPIYILVKYYFPTISIIPLSLIFNNYISLIFISFAYFSFFLPY